MRIATTVQTAIVGSSANAPLRYTLPHVSVAVPDWRQVLNFSQ
jgi:hypothetical protein